MLMWILMAVLSAVFAGCTAVLAKAGIRKTDSDLATALRTGVVLVFAWLMVLVTGAAEGIGRISPRSLVFLVLSGLATGASWLCYFKALSCGSVNQVAPIDKSGTVLTVLLAMAFFGETARLPIRLAGTALLLLGILLMIEKKPETGRVGGGRWMLYAVLSAVFAALTSILAKAGIEGVDSNLATALRTVVVLAMAWGMVFIKGRQSGLHTLDRRELGFIVLSGIATGASWLCYYYAIAHGEVSVAVPIDKMSILVTVLLSRAFFGEKLQKKAKIGLCVMLAGTLVLALVR